jgi:hypothetical protein
MFSDLRNSVVFARPPKAALKFKDESEVFVA